MNQTIASDSAVEPAPADSIRSSAETSASRPHVSVVFRLIRTLLHGIPILLVLAALAGLAYLGHHYGWSLPKFSDLTTKNQTSQVLWCDEHGVAEAECISCNPDLMPKGELFGWCKEHGVHECVLHNPQLSQLKELQAVNRDDIARARRAMAVRPRIKNDPGCKMHLRRIQFPSIEAVNRAGIDIGLVDRGTVVETVTVSGEIVYDPTRVAQFSSRAAGTVWRVAVNVGDTVQLGDVLAIVDTVDVGRAKSRLLEDLVALDLAKKTYSRLQRLGGTVIPAKKIQEAESAKAASQVAVANAAQMLSNLGLPIHADDYLDQPIEKVRNKLHWIGLPTELHDSAGPSTNLLPIFALRNGIVVQQHAVAGEVVEAGQPLFKVVDTSQVWLLLNVPLEEADRVSIGQKIIFQRDGNEDKSIGNVTWISTDVDSETRTVQVRGELDNADGRLRNETFGSGEIVLREEKDAVIVPDQAIHWEGCCHVAFVRDKHYFQDGSYKVFHTRSVRPGAKLNGTTEVIAGLLPGEVVVTTGSGILRAELLKGNLGAG